MGQRLQATPNQAGEDILARREMSYLLLSWIVVRFWYQVRLLQRCTTRQVTSSSTRKTGAIHQKKPNKNKKRITMEHRENDCETFRNGQRSSQKFSKIPKCLQPHTVLMTQIRNVLQKWHPGSTVFLYSLPKRSKLRITLPNQNDKGSLHKTHWQRSSSSSRKKLVT